jgi:hypothetical protein
VSWVAGNIHCAAREGFFIKPGYTYKGLGLRMIQAPSPKGRRPAEWLIIHLGSGHGIAVVAGTVSDVFPIVHELAEAGDWTFIGLDGWRNQFPEAKAATRAWLQRYSKFQRPFQALGRIESAARAVAMARS